MVVSSSSSLVQKTVVALENRHRVSRCAWLSQVLRACFREPSSLCRISSCFNVRMVALSSLSSLSSSSFFCSLSSLNLVCRPLVVFQGAYVCPKLLRLLKLIPWAPRRFSRCVWLPQAPQSCSMGPSSYLKVRMIVSTSSSLL